MKADSDIPPDHQKPLLRGSPYHPSLGLAVVALVLAALCTLWLVGVYDAPGET